MPPLLWNFVFRYFCSQILLAKPTDDWKEILLNGKVTSMHILEPIAMNVSADLCVVDDDPRLPKTRISC